MEAQVTTPNHHNTLVGCEVGQFHSGVGDNIKIEPVKKKAVDHVVSWYGILGTTATIVFGLLGWYALNVQLGWWFFGL